MHKQWLLKNRTTHEICFFTYYYNSSTHLAQFIKFNTFNKKSLYKNLFFQWSGREI